jgi:hypothetical protein
MPAILSPKGNLLLTLAALPSETAILHEIMRFVYMVTLGVRVFISSRIVLTIRALIISLSILVGLALLPGARVQDGQA